ncbi:MAG TPA: transposase, partial [Chitinophagaceae bacterium]
KSKCTVRYSLSFKHQVVREIEEDGMGFGSVRRKYGIKGGSTIQKWLRKFGKTHLLNQIIRVETMEEKDRIKYLEEEIKKLKLALADSMLAQRSLEVVIDEANKEYKTDLKKSFGEPASIDSGKSSV